jgi:hypothetical protein
MRLIRPSFEIASPIRVEEMLALIERAARTCYKSEGDIDLDMFEDTIKIRPKDQQQEEREILVKVFLEARSARELIAKLIARGHEAMLEFGGTIHVVFTCDRGVSHEIYAPWRVVRSREHEILQLLYR